MLTSAQTRPEPMNSSPHHPKVKVSLTFAHPIFVAGKYVAGKMEVECRADKGLGIGVMMVELFAIQELTSRDHSATSTFLHSRRLFQGPGLPPSNAVQAHPLPGDPPLPQHYHQARRGISTFLFRIPLPSSAPASISFASDLARVRYEIRATVGVVWKGEKRLVVFKREIEVVESFEEDFSRVEPEGVVVGEYGKIWVQGRVVGGVVVAGESACVELQVKNHSSKKNSGLSLVLSRELILPGLKPGESSSLEISETLTSVPFRGPEYIIPPGAEGVASLVFDVPSHARGVRGGTLEGDESEARTTESIFEIRCIVGITINMGMGTKDIHLDLPVQIAHPAALPEPDEYRPVPYNTVYPDMATPYAQPVHPVTPTVPAAYIDPIQNQVWLPPPIAHTPQPNGLIYLPPVNGTTGQPYYFPPPLDNQVSTYLPTRPLSAGPNPSDSFSNIPMGPAPPPSLQQLSIPTEPEEGKGERASRVAQHLRLSSRHRSVSPMSHRFPLPAPPTGPTVQDAPPLASPSQPVVRLRNLPPPPIPLSNPASNSGQGGGANLAVVAEPILHSPRPQLSPKQSFNNLVPKSERVEELERMADEVGKATVDLSADLPKAAGEARVVDGKRKQAVRLEVAMKASSAAPPAEATKPIAPKPSVASVAGALSLSADSNINKTLPIPPPPTKKVKEKDGAPHNDRPRIDKYFDSPPAPNNSMAPRTPMAAVTPVKLSKPKSVEFRAQLSPDGRTESGLDILEKRLLAEVGTRKLDPMNDRRPVWSVLGVQPIKIPVKETSPDPLNDSAISSLTLAGEGLGRDEEVEVDGELALEIDGDHDSDEKTHRAGLSSSVSGGSRRGSKEKSVKGERGRKKGKSKVQDKSKDGESHISRRKRTAAAKGRVAAWLGGIDPEVPPVEEDVPPSPAVARKFPPFPADDDGGQLPKAVDADESTLSDDVKSKVRDDVAATPNPRSSGFVPIGTLKHTPFQRSLKPLAKDATIVLEARRVADIWSSSSQSPAVVDVGNISPVAKDKSAPVLKDVLPMFPKISSAPRTPQSIRTNRKVSPPSVAGAVDVLGARYHNINVGKPPASKPPLVKSPPPKKVVPQVSNHLSVFPQLDPEVKYDVRSARGGRGGRVTAITSIWQSAEPGPTANPTKDIPSSAPKSTRLPVTELKVKDTPSKTVVDDPAAITTKARPRTPIKSLLTATAPSAVSQNSEPKVELSGRHPRPLIKSSSVPAVISSSHATPTLSSTASLARPPPNRNRSAPVKLPAISEMRSDSGKRVLPQPSVKPPAPPAKPGAVGGELAFGQTRLRDLIKKYQGQST